MKMKPIKTRKAWTTTDVDQLLVVYFTMLQHQQRGEHYVKAPMVRKLAEQQGRTKASVECKLMNVSHCMSLAGKEWVKGYKPLKNINRELYEQVAEFFVQSIAA